MARTQRRMMTLHEARARRSEAYDMSYYYFMASMPLLTMRGSAPLSVVEFVSLVAAHVPEAEMERLQRSGLFVDYSEVLRNGAGAMLNTANTSDMVAAHMVEHERASARTTNAFDDGRVGDASGDNVSDNDASDNAYAGHIFAARQWLCFDNGLRGEIARGRALSQKSEVDIHWPVLNSFIHIEEVRRILQYSDPMKMEMSIHDMRWGFLDEIESSVRDALDQVVIYYLKLKLLERIDTMDPLRASKKMRAIQERARMQLLQKMAVVHGDGA